MIAAALEHQPERTEGIRLDRARVLHLAPEYCLESKFRPRASKYVGTWFVPGQDNTDVQSDATRMPFQPAAFDVVIACDVLEHIVDDQTAMREIWRILRPGGVAILTVPTFDGQEPTFEDPSIVSPDARERAFGQFDHVRNYGVDFADRLRGAGFAVSVVDASTFEPALVRRSVLHPPEPITWGAGWNNRRIFFARRPESKAARVCGSGC